MKFPPSDTRAHMQRHCSIVKTDLGLYDSRARFAVGGGLTPSSTAIHKPRCVRGPLGKAEESSELVVLLRISLIDCCKLFNLPDCCRDNSDPSYQPSCISMRSALPKLPALFTSLSWYFQVLARAILPTWKSHCGVRNAGHSPPFSFPGH